ncbi:MAG: hypothetical protein PHY31_01640 [Smithellaceae bacterium]|nr:hypothetical protein [Smithellaceae bacterium]
MNERTYTEILPQNKATELKPWQTPAVEEMDINQTENDFIAVTDSTSFFS